MTLYASSETILYQEETWESSMLTVNRHQEVGRHKLSALAALHALYKQKGRGEN